MSRTIILRFRDLVTENGGTIAEHRKLLDRHKEVWWGWGMKQYETVPYAILSELGERIAAGDTPTIFLYDTGQTQLYRATLKDIRVAPLNDVIATPEPTKMPFYYQHGRYPAWYLLTSIEPQPWAECEFYYDAFPTKPERGGELLGLLKRRVDSLDQLRHIDVTLWAIQMQDH